MTSSGGGARRELEPASDEKESHILWASLSHSITSILSKHHVLIGGILPHFMRIRLSRGPRNREDPRQWEWYKKKQGLFYAHSLDQWPNSIVCPLRYALCLILIFECRSSNTFSEFSSHSAFRSPSYSSLSILLGVLSQARVFDCPPFPLLSRLSEPSRPLPAERIASSQSRKGPKSRAEARAEHRRGLDQR